MESMLKPHLYFNASQIEVMHLIPQLILSVPVVPHMRDERRNTVNCTDSFK